MSVMEIFGWVLFAASFATLVTWAVCRERKERRAMHAYRTEALRAEMRADLIAELGIQDEVSS